MELVNVDGEGYRDETDVFSLLTRDSLKTRQKVYVFNIDISNDGVRGGGVFTHEMMKFLTFDIFSYSTFSTTFPPDFTFNPYFNPDFTLNVCNYFNIFT